MENQTLFDTFQKPILRLANNRWGRKFLGIDKEIGLDKRISFLTPNSYSFETGRIIKEGGIWQKEYCAIARCADIFAKRLSIPLTTLGIARDKLIYRDLSQYRGLLNYAGITADNRFPEVLLLTADDQFCSLDGNVYVVGAASWTAARDAATGTVTSPGGAYENSLASKISPTDWRVYRLYFVWNLALGNIRVTNCDSKFYHTADSLVDADNSTIILVSNSQASNTALVAGDFVNQGTTNLATAEIDITGLANAYFTLTLSSGNFNQVNPNGYTKFGLKIKMDAANTEPTGNNAASIAMTAAAGTSTDPKLAISYIRRGEVLIY